MSFVASPRAVVMVVVVALLVALVPTARRADAATSMSVSWSLPTGKSYSIGIDHVRLDGSSNGGYEQFYEWPTSIYNNNPIMPNPVGIYSASTLSEVRMEFYQSPTGKVYSTSNGSAVAIRLAPGGSRNIGAIAFPIAGSPGTGQFTGNVLSKTAVASGRVNFEIFQWTGQPTSSTGVELDAFSAGPNSGGTYTTGPLWNGKYLAFVTDTATGRQALGIIDLNGRTVLDIDLDVVCFGMDECQWTGTVPDAGGEFHATPPTRIVDTRLNQGIAGIVTPGDGRNPDPNPDKRLASRLNHEFQATGVGGVPRVGVSAVLINVTVTGGTSSGSLRVFPKPPRTGIFADQSSFPASNTQSAAVWWNPGEAKASLQLVEVGAGGRIRVDNVSYGNVHLVVDVVGWFDESQPGQDGGRLMTINPTRFLDSRIGTGTELRKFGDQETRTLQVADRDGIGADAMSVIGTLTSVNADGRSYQTVWPGGTMPTASVLNTITGQVRPNLVSVSVGTGSLWSMFNFAPSTDLIFDAVGWFTNTAGTGGDTTAIPSATVLGPTAFAQYEDRVVTVTGRGGVPASGVKAVWVQTTANFGSTRGFLTVYPNGITRPTASNLNWVPNQSVSNLALVPVGTNGAIRVYNATGTAAVTVAVVGWVSA